MLDWCNVFMLTTLQPGSVIRWTSVMSLCEHYSQGQLDVGPVQCLYVNLTVRVHYTSPISKVVQHLTDMTVRLFI